MRKAVKWISASLLEKERESLDALIQKANATFNLSPKEEERLKSFYKK